MSTYPRRPKAKAFDNAVDVSDFFSLQPIKHQTTTCDDPNLIRFDVSVLIVLVPRSIASTHNTRCNIKINHMS